MKLTRGKLVETIRRKNDGWTTYQVRKIAGISIRRVNQVMRCYETTGLMPEIGKTNGRPSKLIEGWEIDTVKEAYQKYRVSADTLERLIDRDYGKHIGHNRIHRILVELGYAKRKSKKDIRKKDWIRYQRRHSLTAVHIDWHYDGKVWVFAVIDDASRKLLAIIECSSPTTDASIQGMEMACKHGRIKQCISDHGAQFVANNTDGNSRFKEYLDSKGINQILCRIKHPQSNGKVEKWFETYDKHRHAFKSLEEFCHWYNEMRPHRSLKFEILETPQEAFIRKMPAIQAEVI
ncbi:MAG TPA: DDE-type integrase/transposase/recombinase [Candidatus Nanoarchaeia archaeon]|nr:DDE-type integrase/transposase/recombinase [Candidatus Nanoarchaeia archaeon]